MNNLEIKHLRMVCAIAETGNMTRAAERLFLTQSALSQQLKDIELRLGVEIFIRSKKKMVLSAVGKSLLPTAKEVVAAVENAELEITKRVKGESGELRVGTQCIFCYKWLPKVMTAFQEKFPLVEITVGNVSDLVGELEDRQYDLIITGAPAPSRKFHAVSLFADQLICLLGSYHPLVAHNHVEYADFAGENLISHADADKNRFYQQALKARGIEPAKILPIGAPQAMLEMVAAGFGVSVFPRWAVRGHLDNSAIVAKSITARGLPMTWYAVYPASGQVPLFLHEFLRLISRSEILTG